MEYTFTIAKRSDTPEILKLYKSLIGMPGCNWTSDYPNREIVETDINNDSLYKIIDKNHNLIAVITIEDGEEFGEFTGKVNNMCILSRLAVRAEKQEEGIDDMLLKKTISTARRKGYSGVTLLVGKDNNAVKSLYENNGFVFCGEIFIYGFDYCFYELLF